MTVANTVAFTQCGKICLNITITIIITLSNTGLMLNRINV